MITLHGTYDNGKVILEEKDLPRIKAKARIEILDEKKDKQPVHLGKYNLGGFYDEKNVRDIAHE